MQQTTPDRIKTENTILLTQSTSAAFRKRVKREIESMYSMYEHIEVRIWETDKMMVSICDSTYKYRFVITNNYPFKGPTTFFQDRPYIEFLRTNYPPSMLDIFQKITGKQSCFCCTSLNCTNNWRPVSKLIHIIEEIHTIQKQKRDIINVLLADKIKQKYLIDDIDLNSWLC